MVRGMQPQTIHGEVEQIRGIPATEEVIHVAVVDGAEQ